MRSAFAATALLVAAACTSNPAPHPRLAGSAPPPQTTSPPPVAAPARPGPPEGFFSTHCLFSHSGRVDPIVFPGLVGRSHVHDFFGNTSTSETSTAESLRAAATTSCATRADRAAYWTPAFYMGGMKLHPPYQNEYWFDGGFRRVAPVPFGMSLVAGDSHATGEQPTDHVYYFCGGTHGPVHSPHSARPYDCSPYVRRGDTSGVIAVVIFPQCWDGQLGPGNDTAHVVYPLSPGVCPVGFDIALPRLEEHLHLGIVDPIARDGSLELNLSSGPYYTLHGDFMNAWVPSALARMVVRCIDSHVQCLGHR